MEMIEGMRTQIWTQLKKSSLLGTYKSPQDSVNANSKSWNVVKAALAMGAYPNIARLDRQDLQLRTLKEAKVRFHPSCEILRQQKVK